MLDQFELSDEDLENLTGKFHTDLIESLYKESHGSPLHVQISPLPEQNSSFSNKTSSVTLLWTATGISIHQVMINGDAFNARPLENMKLLPSDIKTVDVLVDRLSQYLVEAAKIADTSSAILIHDFVTSDDNKLNISCINDPSCWKLEGDRNIDIFSLLKNSLQTKGINIQMISTVDAGMTYGLHNHSVTVTLGSKNSNSYFQHTTDKAPQLNTRGSTKLFGVVTNWGTFGEQNNSLSEYNAAFDFVLDAESKNKGQKLFEKVVSDVYLIDIVWRVIISMIAEGTLFNGKLPPTMDKDTFVTVIGCIVDNKCDTECEAVMRLLDQLSVPVNAKDLATLSKVTSIVYQRAAKFVAVGIAAVLREIKEEECRVIVVGTSRLYLWLELIQSTVNHLLPGCKVELEYNKNGVLFGAALADLK